MENFEVPPHWEVAPLMELCTRLVDGSHNPPEKKNSGEPMLSAINIHSNSIDFSTYRLIDKEDFEKENHRTKVAPGDVLLTIVGAIGRAAVVPKNIKKFTLQRSVAVIKPIEINSKFLMYQLESPDIYDFFKKNARGTAQKGIYLKTLGTTVVRVPPLNEQKRIVAKIEALFSELDKGIESLKTARAQLKTYRQAILKHAFEGHLTADWREQNKDKLETADQLLARIKQEREAHYQQQLKDWQHAVKEWEKNGEEGKKPAKPKFQKGKKQEHTLATAAKQLPLGWRPAEMQEMAELITDGTHHTPTYVNSGVPFISVKDIKNNAVNFNDCKFISQEEHKSLIKRCFPEPGDLLITKSGTIGRMAIAPDREFSLFVSVALIKLQSAKKFISVNWLQYVFEYHLLGLNIDQEIKGGVIKNYHLEDLRLALIPLCSYQEQLQIVRGLEDKLSVVDNLELEVENNLNKTEALRQSILKKAFAGKLVAQDPNDESASALLERIRAERAKATPKKQTRKPKKAAAS